MPTINRLLVSPMGKTSMRRDSSKKPEIPGERDFDDFKASVAHKMKKQTIIFKYQAEDSAFTAPSSEDVESDLQTKLGHDYKVCHRNGDKIFTLSHEDDFSSEITSYSTIQAYDVVRAGRVDLKAERCYY